jgi:uncharacterized membrane protein (UPF0127 family)
MNSQLKLFIFLISVIGIFFFVQNKFNIFDIKFDNIKNSLQNIEEIQDTTVIVYNQNGTQIQINVEIANTPEERKIGLSGRNTLGEYNGMLFVMDDEALTAFWMKDMLIPLDMIFIDSNGFIVDIKRKVEPCSFDFCPNIIPSSPFKYNIEVNSGFTDTNGIAIGNSVDIKL